MRLVNVPLLVGVLLLLLTLGVTARAEASSTLERVELGWHAPPECPSREAVLAEVARALADSREEPVAVVAQVDIAILDNGRWRAVMVIEAREAHDRRQFEAATCAELASAAALIVAVSLEGGAARPALASGAARAAPKAARGTEPSRPPTGAWQFVAAVAGLIDAGTMPSVPAGGVELALGASHGISKVRLYALAGVEGYPAQTVPVGRNGERGRFSLGAVSARACASLVQGRFAWGPCLGAQIDVMGASGTGPSDSFQSGSVRSSWGAALGGAVASWSVASRASIFARTEAVFSLRQTRFVLSPSNAPVHEPGRVAGRAAIGVELRFF
jgi:hypothetical protein